MLSWVTFLEDDLLLNTRGFCLKQKGGRIPAHVACCQDVRKGMHALLNRSESIQIRSSSLLFSS